MQSPPIAPGPTTGPMPPLPAQEAMLPPDLEARLAAFENTAPAADFDGPSWLWMGLLGIALPMLLLAAGWWA